MSDDEFKCLANTCQNGTLPTGVRCVRCFGTGEHDSFWVLFCKLLDYATMIRKNDGYAQVLSADDPATASIGWSVFDTKARWPEAGDQTKCFLCHVNGLSQSAVADELGERPFDQAIDRQIIAKILTKVANLEDVQQDLQPLEAFNNWYEAFQVVQERIDEFKTI